MKPADYLDALEWDNALHGQGHSQAGTCAAECGDHNCSHYGRNRPLPSGLELRLEAVKVASDARS